MRENFKEQVASELRCLRAKFDYKQKEVANKAKIDVMTLARYENNSASMQLDMIEKIIKVYNLTLDIFFDNVSANMHNNKLIQKG